MTEPTSQAPLLGSTEDATVISTKGERTRLAAVQVVQAIYRLAKASLIHAESNEAVQNMVRFAQAAVVEFCQSADAQSVCIHFTSDTIFVNGHMLRASRQAYTCAAELSAMLDKGGVSEITLPLSVAAEELTGFAAAMLRTVRGPAGSDYLAKTPCGSIRLRRCSAQATQGATDQGTARDRLLRTYAASVVVMRQFLEGVLQGDNKLPQRIKRVAQRLITHGEEDVRALVSLVASQPAAGDPAVLAVNTAILTVAMALQLTHDRSLLTAAAMSALMYDVGRLRLQVRLSRNSSAAMLRALNDDELDVEPQSAVVMLTVLGRIHQPSMRRVVITYEATWLHRADELGQPYKGKRPPTVLARCLFTCRAFVELISPAPGEPTVSIDDAIQLLSARAKDSNDRTDIKLLLGALGFFPPGTPVELNTGELAVVIAAPRLAVDFARPRIRILYDANMRLLEQPQDVDLAAQLRPGEVPRCVRRAADADERLLKQMRAFVATTTAAKPPSETARPAGLRALAKEPVPSGPQRPAWFDEQPVPAGEQAPADPSFWEQPTGIPEQRFHRPSSAPPSSRRGQPSGVSPPSSPRVSPEAVPDSRSSSFRSASIDDLDSLSRAIGEPDPSPDSRRGRVPETQSPVASAPSESPPTSRRPAAGRLPSVSSFSDDASPRRRPMPSEGEPSRSSVGPRRGPELPEPAEDPSLIRGALVFPGRESEIEDRAPLSRHPGYEPDDEPPSTRRSAARAARAGVGVRRRDPRTDTDPEPVSSRSEPASPKPRARELGERDSSVADARTSPRAEPLVAIKETRPEATRQVSWADYAGTVKGMEGNAQPAPPQAPPGGIDDLLSAFLDDDALSSGQGGGPSEPPLLDPDEHGVGPGATESPPTPSRRARPANPGADDKTRAVRWSAAEAFLRDLEAESGTGDDDGPKRR